jgi:hypothetical protein
VVGAALFFAATNVIVSGAGMDAAMARNHEIPATIQQRVTTRNILAFSSHFSSLSD